MTATTVHPARNRVLLRFALAEIAVVIIVLAVSLVFGQDDVLSFGYNLSYAGLLLLIVWAVAKMIGWRGIANIKLPLVALAITTFLVGVLINILALLDIL